MIKFVIGLLFLYVLGIIVEVIIVMIFLFVNVVIIDIIFLEVLLRKKYFDYDVKIDIMSIVV